MVHQQSRASSSSSARTLAQDGSSDPASDKRLKPEPARDFRAPTSTSAQDDQDMDALAEYDFAEFGGDMPTDPALQRKCHAAAVAAAAAHQKHGSNVKITGTTTTTRPRRVSSAGGRPPTIIRSRTGQAPSLHLVDSAWSASHAAMERASRSSTHASSSGSSTAADESEPRQSTRQDKQSDKREEDPNKVTWRENDPENPQNWSNKRKWLLTIFCGLLTVVVTFASSAPSSATMGIAQDFGVGQVPAVLTTSMFLLGYCLGPILWAPLSELFGRRPIFILSFFGFALFQIPCALAPNLGGLITCRFIAGTFAASPLTNCGGVIADIWDAVGRGPSMSLFSASVFLGPVVGPIIGGFVYQSYLGWRWIFWIICIWAFASFAAIVVLMPETYHPALLAKRAKKLRKQEPEKNRDLYADLEKADFSVKALVTRTLGRPFLMLGTEPILMLVTLYLSLVYGILYATFGVFPILFEQLRGFTPGQSGLTFIGVGIGTSIGALINVWVQRHYRHLVPKWHGHPPPEERLYGAMIAGPFLVVGIFWLGWTGNYPSIHWAVPAASGIIIGISFTLVFISFLSYIIEVYLMYASSALAANTIVRSAFGAAFPLFISQMYSGLGVNWASTLIALVCLLIAPSPVLFYFYGARIRGQSKFAPCLDIPMRERLEREEREEKEKQGQQDSTSADTRV
ncbi:hypothetical protein OIO90_004106 [Microbotryomycetes sp. JL221]|nr:hypothetical protein OIO90_004106 [Microbotryomycetes sp. JL221]